VVEIAGGEEPPNEVNKAVIGNLFAQNIQQPVVVDAFKRSCMLMPPSRTREPASACQGRSMAYGLPGKGLLPVHT